MASEEAFATLDAIEKQHGQLPLTVPTDSRATARVTGDIDLNKLGEALERSLGK